MYSLLFCYYAYVKRSGDESCVFKKQRKCYKTAAVKENLVLDKLSKSNVFLYVYKAQMDFFYLQWWTDQKSAFDPGRYSCEK